MYKASILLINKAVGIRSTECVEKVRRILGRKVKVGHSGTLDSTASGLLVLLVGPATRLSDFLMGFSKVYKVTLQLGVEKTTDDASGETSAISDWRDVSHSDIDLAIFSYLGWRSQTPPDISAVHVAGKRAHDLVRSGISVDIAPRNIFIEQIVRESPISCDGRVSFTVTCGKGTYIRSFARDIGRKLACCAHVVSLTRQSLGGLSLDCAMDTEKIFSSPREQIVEYFLSPTLLCNYAPSYSAKDNDQQLLVNGLPVPLTRMIPHRRIKMTDNKKILVIGTRYLSLCELVAKEGTLLAIPKTNIPLEERN